MKNKHLYIFLIFLIFIEPAFAFETIKNAQTEILTSFEKFAPQFKAAGMTLFYSLALIEIVISTGLMAVRGELEMGAVFANLVKLMLVFGFFYAVLNSMAGLGFNTIFEKFQSFGNSGGVVSFDDIGTNILGIWTKLIEIPIELWEKSDPVTGVGEILAFISQLIFIVPFLLLITIGIYLLTAIVLSYWAFALMSAYFGIMWVGLGAFSQTRSYAIHAITNMVRWGLKYMFGLLIISIVLNLANNFTTTVLSQLADTTLQSYPLEPYVSFLVVLVVLIIITMGLSGWVDSYFTGSGGGAGIGEAAGKMAQAATTMAAVAAAGAGGVAGIKSGANNAISAAKAGGASPLGVGLSAVRAGVNGLGSTAKEMGQAAFKGANSRASGSETSLSNTFQGANSKTSGEASTRGEKDTMGSSSPMQSSSNTGQSSNNGGSPLGNGLGGASNTE